VDVIHEWEAIKRYIVERARVDAVTGENPTIRTLAHHVVRAVEGGPRAVADTSSALPAFLRPQSLRETDQRDPWTPDAA
jgi:hypothetical protein